MSSALHADIAASEASIKECLVMRDELQGILDSSPDDQQTVSEMEEIKAIIAAEEQNLASLKAKLAKEEAGKEPPKFRVEDHPAFQAKQQPAIEKPVVTFKVNDVVEARWTDRSWYKAKITMVTGSSAAPKYRVNFVDYNDSATVESGDIRPIYHDSRKRKAEALQPAPQPAPTTTPVPVHANPAVISAAAKINHELANQVRQDPVKHDDAESRPKKKKKVGTTKALEASKASWQSFQAKKGGKKDSMFRTGDAPNARVGFTGSGAGMRRDPKRGRHVYQPTNGDEDTIG